MIDFICPACNISKGNACALNKHLQNCELYDEWIKTYIPPKTTQCESCKRNLLDITKHKCDKY